MVKQLFTLASVIALTGLVFAGAVVGCSSDAALPSGEQPDAMSDVKRVVDPPAGPEPEPEPEPAPSCVSTDPIDATQFPYEKAQRSPRACTDAELTALSAFFEAKVDANEAVLASAWQKEVSDKCADCVFSDGKDAKWTPIIVSDDTLDTVNRGGCIEIVSGKEACGEAYQRATVCRVEACRAKCTTQTELLLCLERVKEIFTGPCKTAHDTMTSACGDGLDSYEAACKGSAWTFEGPIRAQCIIGGDGNDAGADGG